MSLIQRKEKILQELSKITVSDDRYKYIIAKGRNLPELTTEQKDDKFLVEGCISRAWLIPRLEGDRVFFSAHSESAIVKGIIAILLEVYNDATPDEILGLSPEFLRAGGIVEHLSMNRRNGLANISRQIQLYAVAYKSLLK